MKNNSKRIRCLGFAAAALLASSPALAVDSVSFEAGHGTGVAMWRLGAQWNWQKKWFTGGRWHLGGYWDAQLGAWHGERDLWDVSLTPVFRLQASAPSAFSPYVEAAIGFHLLSETRVSDSRRLGSAFQFGDHIGIGARFGERARYDVGLRLQHLSNGGIRKPNPGINFWQLRFQATLD